MQTKLLTKTRGTLKVAAYPFPLICFKTCPSIQSRKTLSDFQDFLSSFQHVLHAENYNFVVFYAYSEELFRLAVFYDPQGTIHREILILAILIEYFRFITSSSERVNANKKQKHTTTSFTRLQDRHSDVKKHCNLPYGDLQSSSELKELNRWLPPAEIPKEQSAQRTNFAQVIKREAFLL